MQIVDLKTASNFTPCAIALGYFDTFHLGHQRLIQEVISDTATPCMFTFTGDFYRALGLADCKPLYSQKVRMDFAAQAGIQTVYTLSPTPATMLLGAYEFFDLLMQVSPVRLVCGRDFRFGQGAKGDVDTLASLCAQANIRLTVLPIMCDKQGNKIGTVALRKALAMGDMYTLREGLGRYYSVYGMVQDGRKVGRTLGAPTANIALDKSVQSPRFGVYACVMQSDGIRYSGVCNIGPHPTFADRQVNLEVNLADFCGDLYGKDVQVDLIDYIRPVRRFDSAEQLRHQIAQDRHTALQIIKEIQDD